MFVRVNHRDPLAKPIPWPGSTAHSIVEPIALGLFDNGEPVRLRLVGEHLLIGGATGRGKSGLLNGSEIHNADGLERMGLALPRAAWPAVGRVQVVAVPKAGWRRFFEYVVLERETGFEPATSTLARLRSTE